MYLTKTSFHARSKVIEYQRSHPTSPNFNGPRFVSPLSSGLIFAFGLGASGMTNPSKAPAQSSPLDRGHLETSMHLLLVAFLLLLVRHLLLEAMHLLLVASECHQR